MYTFPTVLFFGRGDHGGRSSILSVSVPGGGSPMSARAAGTAETLATVSALYEAALDQAQWPDALARLTALTRSQASTFWVLDSSRGSLHPTFISINFDPRAVDEYLGGMAALDPTVRFLLKHPGATIVHDGLLGPQDDDDTRAYLDWHERSVETRYRLVGQSDLGSKLQAGVALHRARRAGRFGQDDIARFEALREHLRRALAVGVRLGSLEAKRQVTEELLDRNLSAVILLDAGGQVVFMTRAAEELAAGADGLRIATDGVHPASRADDERLQAAVARTIASQQSRRALGETLRVSRPSGLQPYAVWVTGVAQPTAALSMFRPAVCLVVADPERPAGPPLSHLQALFGLTLAEARLAGRLAAGESLQAAAAALEITYGTARSRLTQLFLKTGTQSQSQLVRLLLGAWPATSI